MSFDVDVAKWCEKAKDNLESAVRLTLYGLAFSLVYKTPYGIPETWVRKAPEGYVPGTLRAGWHYSADEASTTLPAAPDADGDATLAAIKAAMPAQTVGKVHYFVNNVPYGPEIEYNAHSKQAPAGMVGITAMEGPSIAEKAIQEVVGGEDAFA